MTHLQFTIKILFYKYHDASTMLGSVTKQTSPLHCDFHANSTSEVLYVSWRNLISDLLLTNQLKMAFLFSVDRIPRTFKDNSLKFKLSFIVTYFNF